METGGPAYEHFKGSNGRSTAGNTVGYVAFDAATLSQFEILPVLWQSHLA